MGCCHSPFCISTLGSLGIPSLRHARVTSPRPSDLEELRKESATPHRNPRRNTVFKISGTVIAKIMVIIIYELHEILIPGRAACRKTSSTLTANTRRCEGARVRGSHGPEIFILKVLCTPFEALLPFFSCRRRRSCCRCSSSSVCRTFSRLGVLRRVILMEVKACRLNAARVQKKATAPGRAIAATSLEWMGSRPRMKILRSALRTPRRLVGI